MRRTVASRVGNGPTIASVTKRFSGRLTSCGERPVKRNRIGRQDQVVDLEALSASALPCRTHCAVALGEAAHAIQSVHVPRRLVEMHEPN